MGELAKLHSDLETLVGKLIHDRYRVDSLLGVGGMGAVFKGYHTGLKREVAIKLLHPEIGRDESVSKRFDREAYSASRLDHPNCVRVSDFGTTETGAKYLVMEFLEGAELEASLGKPWPPLEAVRVATQMFAGLEHAHHFGVVHRDLKPENVFVTTDFRGQQLVKLVDFGIAKLLDGEGAQEKLTRAGLVFGTPRYMSPEQAAGGKIDERTDLYAAGLILYEMLAGQPPFDAEEPGQLLRMHIMAPPPPLPSGLPAGLVALVDKLLEKSKADRHANAREVIDALNGLEQELIAGPACGVPREMALAPVVAAMPEAAVAPVRKTGWQPAEPTTSLPAPPPAAAIEPAMAATMEIPVGMTMPMIPGPGPLPTGSHPSLSLGHAATLPSVPSMSSMSNSSSSPSQSWPTTSATYASLGPMASASASQPIERRTIVPWVITGAALLIASLALAGLLLGPGADDETPDDPAPTDTGAIEVGQPAAQPASEPVQPPRIQPAEAASSVPAKSSATKSAEPRKSTPKKESSKSKPKSDEAREVPTIVPEVVVISDEERREAERREEERREQQQQDDERGKKDKGKGKDKHEHPQ